MKILLYLMSVQADTNGTEYYWSEYRVIDSDNRMVEEVVLHEGETLVFTIGRPLEDGTYEALGDNYSFYGDEWRITTWTKDASNLANVDESIVDCYYENEQVKVWEKNLANRRVICVKGLSATDDSDDYNLTFLAARVIQQRIL